LFERDEADPIVFNIEFNGKEVSVRTDQEIFDRFTVELADQIRIFPNHHFMASKTPTEELVDFLRQRAYAMEARGDYNKTMDAYEYAISLRPNDEVVRMEHREFMQLYRYYGLAFIAIMSERGNRISEEARRNLQPHGHSLQSTLGHPHAGHAFFPTHGLHNFANGFTSPGFSIPGFEWWFVPAQYGLVGFPPMPFRMAERVFESVSSLRNYFESLKPRVSPFREQPTNSPNQPVTIHSNPNERR
jgi:hypothetical protein